MSQESFMHANKALILCQLRESNELSKEDAAGEALKCCLTNEISVA